MNDNEEQQVLKKRINNANKVIVAHSNVRIQPVDVNKAVFRMLHRLTDILSTLLVRKFSHEISFNAVCRNTFLNNFWCWRHNYETS